MFRIGGMVSLVRLLFVFSLTLSWTTRTSFAQRTSSRYVNLSHLNHLYQAVQLKTSGVLVGTVAIYSEAPDYHLVTDADEGFTCIDDVARAGLFLLWEPDIDTNQDKQTKLRAMVEFVLQLQATDREAGAGYFYNFLWPDRTINKTFRTSVAEPNFWSWRAMWLLTEAKPYYQKREASLTERIQAVTQKLVANMLRDYGNQPKTYQVVKGVRVPGWLPFGSGTDQAAIMLLSLTTLYQQNPTPDLLKLIDAMGEGILAMQHGDTNRFPYGAILSFENNWHAYASDQSYALLRVGKALNRPVWIAAARREIDHFYPYLLRKGFLESFEVALTKNGMEPVRTSRFSQIAYGIRPMIWAALEVYEQTREAKYADLAGKLASWFLGNNVAKVAMYDVATGHGYDGIGANGQVNYNSGAESTIESLWAFQRLEQYPEAINALKKYN